MFGAVTLTKNADTDKYGYSGYGIRFARKPGFTFSGGRIDQNVIIFGETWVLLLISLIRKETY